MDTNTHHFGTIARTQTAEPHRVLRNTYALLGLSMVPTAIGAAIGTTLLAPLMFSIGMLPSAIIFLIVAFGMMWAIQKNRDNGLGVALLLGFTFFMGLWLGPLLSVALQFRNGGQLIAMAAGGTGAIFFTLAGIAATTKRDFSNMGKFLTVGIVLLIVASLANLFFQIPTLSLAISGVAVLLFSGFILYDINRIVHGGETSYVSATLAVYLNIYNLFTSLLHLLMAFAGDRD
jgi:FtsH-binding integral membrane protein